MKAIQVSSDNYVDIMRQPCVVECHKGDNQRLWFLLKNGRNAFETDWIIDAEDEFDSFVLTNHQFYQVKEVIDKLACSNSVPTKVPKRTDDQSLDDWIKSMVGDNKQLYELLHEVSVESYITGTRISNNEQAVF